MADNKTTIEVSIQAAEAAKTIQELKKSLKDLVNQQANVAAGSAEWKKLTQAINDTEGKIGDLTDSFKTLQGSGVERVTSSFNLLKEGFTSFDSGKIKAAFNGIGAAMKAVPIFLIVEGITYLVSNFKELSQGSGIVAKALQFVGGIIDGLVDAVYMLTDALGLTNSALEEQGEAIKTNADKAKEALANQTAEYDRQIAVAKASGKNAVDLEIAKQQAIINTNKALVEQTIAYVRNGGVLTEEQNKLLTEQLQSIKSAVAQQDVIRLNETKRIEDENKKQAEKQAELNKKRLEEEKKLRDEITAYNRSAVAENQKIDNDEAIAKANLRVARNQDDINAKINLLKVQKDIELQNAELTASARKLIEQRFINDVEALKKAARDKELKEIEDNNKRINDLDNKNLLAGAELRALQNQNDLDAQLALLETKKQLELENTELTENERLLIKQKYAGLEKQAQLKSVQDALKIAEQGTQSLQNLSDIYFTFKKRNLQKGSAEEEKAARQQFKINKALQLTGAIIDGAKAITSSLAQAPVAIGPIPNPAGIASLALAITSSVASIAKIAATKYEGGASGGGGGSISAPSPSIPSPPTVSTPTNNISGTQFDAQGNTITPQAQQPTITVKAQVVESDMTDTQNTVTKYKAQSTF